MAVLLLLLLLSRGWRMCPCVRQRRCKGQAASQCLLPGAAGRAVSQMPLASFAALLLWQWLTAL